MEVFAAAEHEVFEEVGEAGLAGLLVFRADVVPDVDGHDGGFVIFVHDDGEAIVEHEFLVGDIHAGGLGKSARAQQETRQKLIKHRGLIL